MVNIADFTTLPKTCPDDTPPAGEDVTNMLVF